MLHVINMRIREKKRERLLKMMVVGRYRRGKKRRR
jgi:hypothetical protein